MKKIVLGLLSLVLIGGGCANVPVTPAPQITAQPASVINEVRNVNVQPGQLVTSPFTVTGEARGTWFFEAVIGVSLFDANGIKLDQQNYGQAKGEWMTEDFVPFEGTLVFTVTPTTTVTGYIEIHNDNPSGMPENDKSIHIPVRLK